MVFFVCDKCNETLKKSHVEKHCNHCRYCESVTCVDCLVTFYGNDYINHNVCITEKEKYEKTLYKPKQKISTQDLWMNSVNKAIERSDEAPVIIQSFLSNLSNYTNIPRNKKKFENFIKNSLRTSNNNIINELWNWIELNQIKSNEITSISLPEDEVVVAPVDNKRKIDEIIDDKIDKPIDNNLNESPNKHKKKKKKHKESKETQE